MDLLSRQASSAFEGIPNADGVWGGVMFFVKLID